MGAIRLYLFGPLRVAADDRPLSLSAPPRTGPLLAYLALHPTAQDRRTVAAALWPDLDPDEARTNLRRHLHYLRQALPEPDGSPWLLADGSRIGLHPEASWWVDARAFERAGERGELEDATALYSDQLLPELDDEWVLAERERLRSLFLAHLMALAHRHREAGHTPEALAVLDRLLREEPLREDAVRLAMRLRFAAGDRAGALATFERFAGVLASELGVEPMQQTQELFEELVREIPSPTASAAGSPGPPQLPFVGRAQELAELERLWERARQGHGALLLIGGPAGIGKTRLLRRLAQRTEADDGRALVGRTSEPEDMPYEALAEALRPVLPLMTAAGDMSALWRRVLATALPGPAQRGPPVEPLPELPPDRERARLFHAVMRALARLASTRPLLLVLEDLHSAGEASVALVEHLANRATGIPLLIAGSYREDVLAPDHPLRALRHRLEPSGVLHHLALTGLGADAVAEVLTRLGTGARLHPDAVTSLSAVSAGNPLLISELLHEASVRGNAPFEPDGPSPPPEPDWPTLVPEGVRTRVAARLEHLPADARTFAGAASVVGDTFRLETVRDVLGWNEREALDALDILLDARLVRERRIGAFAFHHQLMRETIYQALDVRTRQRHHRRTARTLSRGGAVPASAAALARHYDLGGEPEQAARHTLAAARDALDAGAGEEARQLVERGLALTQEPTLRLALLQLGEDQARRNGDRGRQRRYLDAIDTLTQALADDDAAFDAMTRRVVLLRDLGEREHERTLLDRLSEVARRDGRPVRLARAALLRAGHALVLGDPEAAERELAEASACAEQADDRRLRVATACLGAHVALAGGKLDRVHERLDAAQQAGAAQEPELMGDAVRASLLGAIGREAYEDALTLAGRMLALAVATGDRTLEADAHQYRAVCSARLARLSEARAHYRVAEGIYRDLERPQGLAAVALNRGLLDLRLGDHGAAADRLDTAATLFARLGDRRGETLCLLNGSSALLYGQRYAEARDAALRALELSEASANELLAASALSNLGDAERHLGAFDDAIAHLCQAVAIERHLERDASTANALCELALAYLAEGRFDEAGAAADDLLELLARRDEELLHPQQVAWVAARVRHAQGHEVEARRLVGVAAERLRARVAIIDEDGARRAFEAMEFNREIAAAAEEGRWP